jgi:hypothetical protein
MSANVLTASPPTPGIAVFRRWLLRIHGTILTLVVLANCVATSSGWITGTGPFGFMNGNPMVWVGLIQAYLLMGIIAVLLVLGSGQADTRKWHVVGALAHCAPLTAALASLDVFESMGVAGFVWIPISFHIVFFCLEGFAALYPNRTSASG